MKKVIAFMLMLCTPAAAQNFLRDDGIFQVVPLTVGTNPVTGGSDGAPLFNSGGLLANGSISSTWSTFLQIGTGATTRTAQDKMRDNVHVKDYGAVCDGVTDDRASIQKAIDANPGANVHIPASGCAFGKTPAQPYGLIINNAASLKCDGGRAPLTPLAATVTSATDLIYVVPLPAVSWFGWSIQGCLVGDNISGRDAVRVDSQTTGNNTFRGVAISNNVLAGANGGYGFHHINDAAANVNGAFFASTLRENIYVDGIYLENSGDSIQIVGGQTTGVNGIWAKLVPGAQGPNISGVNYTSSGGIRIDCASKPVIGPWNTLEQTLISTELNNALIDFTGTTCSISNPLVFGNSISNTLAGQTPTLIRGGTSTGLIIQSNNFITQSDYTPINLTINTTTAIVDANNRFENTGGVITTPVVAVAASTKQTLTTIYGSAAINGIPYKSDLFNLTFTAAMTDGQLLVGQTSAAPLPKTITGCALTAAGAFSCPASTITSAAALSKADDTNVTLTLTGTPTTALLAATTITAGWTGTLAKSRGGTGGSTGAVVSVTKQIFTSSGTYTPTAGMLYASIDCVGSGGGAGSAAGTASNIYSGGGGGAGGLSRVLAAAATIGASKTITVGNAGTGGASGSNNGTDGSDVCLTSSTCSSGQICNGKGGKGGLYGSIAQVPLAGAGGATGTGDFVATGAAGLPGFYNSAAGVTGLSIAFPSGGGGSSFFGGGAQGVNCISAAVTGLNGTNYGGGGSGACTNNTTSTAAGGDGSKGIVVITEYNSQ